MEITGPIPRFPRRRRFLIGWSSSPSQGLSLFGDDTRSVASENPLFWVASCILSNLSIVFCLSTIWSAALIRAVLCSSISLPCASSTSTNFSSSSTTLALNTLSESDSYFKVPSFSFWSSPTVLDFSSSFSLYSFLSRVIASMVKKACASCCFSVLFQFVALFKSPRALLYLRRVLYISLRVNSIMVQAL